MASEASIHRVCAAAERLASGRTSLSASRSMLDHLRRQGLLAGGARAPQDEVSLFEKWADCVRNLGLLLEGAPFGATTMEPLVGLMDEIENLVPKLVGYAGEGVLAFQGATVAAVFAEGECPRDAAVSGKRAADLAAGICEAALLAVAKAESPDCMNPDPAYSREALALVGCGDGGPIPAHPALFEAEVDVWGARALLRAASSQEVLGAALPLALACPKGERAWVLATALGMRVPRGYAESPSLLGEDRIAACIKAEAMAPYWRA